ncbi:hypothetical protein KP509_34G036500 [Ceratopteris richardii]|nr:hypothetical protein KP509_34G036500 [Ceratopteris richardii]
MEQRWNWVLAKLENKLNYWRGMQINLAGRAMVINTFLLSSTIYFLSCWRPNEQGLSKLNSICRNFLWTGDHNRRGVPKIKWVICTSPRDSGGLGILDIGCMANKLAAKWMIKAWCNREASWAKLIFRNKNELALTGSPNWKNLDIMTLLFSPIPVFPKGSTLVCSLWKGWNKVKSFTRMSEDWKWAAGIRQNDSIWFPIHGIRSVESWNIQNAKKLWNKGFKKWKHLWKHDTNSWINYEDIDPRINISYEEWNTLQSRCLAWDRRKTRLVMGHDAPNARGLKWHNGNSLLKIPNIKETTDLQISLNKKWCLSWTRLRWDMKFMGIWHPLIEIKKSVLLWQILHRGIWTNHKASKICGTPPWCKRCHRAIEDVPHIFLTCPNSYKIWQMVGLKIRVQKQLSWKQVLLGEAIGCSAALWNAIRGEVLWKIWRERCALNFGDPPREWSIEKSLFLLGKRIVNSKKSPPFRHHQVLRLINNKLKPKWVPHEGDERVINLLCIAT